MVATGTVVGLLGFGFALVSPRTAAGLALAVWASLWGPQQAQNAGWYRVGWCPPVVIAGLALVAPTAAVLLGTAGGASGAWVRSSGDAVGFTPTARQRSPGASNPNILLVTLDGIRKDNLLLRGPLKPTSLSLPWPGGPISARLLLPRRGPCQCAQPDVRNAGSGSRRGFADIARPHAAGQ